MQEINNKTRLVPKLRFKEFVGETTTANLEHVSSIRTGPFGSVLHQEDYAQKGTPIITVEHLSDQGIVHGNLPLVSESDIERLKSYILLEGDIVFSRVGSVDRNSIITSKENGWLFSGRLLRIRTNREIILPKFLSYFFQKEITKHRIRSVSVGQTMASLNTEILKSFSIQFPKQIPEQQKIAAFLSAVDEKIQQLTRTKELLEQYKKGVMQQVFSGKLRFKPALSGAKGENGKAFSEWEEKRLGDVLNIGSGRDYKHLKDGDIPVFGTGGLMTKVNEFLYDGETVCIGRKGTIDKPMYYNGKIWTVDTLFFTYNFQNAIPKFIYYIFQQINWKIYNEASGVPSLSKTTIEKIYFFLPCLEEQQKIAEFLSSLDTKIERVTEQITHTQAFKKGLLQQMFV